MKQVQTKSIKAPRKKCRAGRRPEASVAEKCPASAQTMPHAMLQKTLRLPLYSAVLPLSREGGKAGESFMKRFPEGKKGGGIYAKIPQNQGDTCKNRLFPLRFSLPR
ncbi:hypothetical protein [Mailhella massiliensis]|uniref:hypothetical protein n=1 Tax=Mailhella massiliensis TaxID=1903261 RepID=UPI0023EFFAA3|nr:hypothetical protein [Mailhella massiliensis]